MTVLKGAALALATLIYCKVILDMLAAKEFLVVAPMAALFLVLAYLGADLKVRNFSYDADDHKLRVNEEEPKNDPKE